MDPERGGPSDREAEDDDFGDFGGFEGADEVPNLPASQAQASASPWAVLTTGNASGRPDLLCAQNSFPNCLDPSVINGASPDAAEDLSSNNSGDGGAQPAPPPVDLVRGNMLESQDLRNQARIAENVLDGTLNVAAGAANFLPGPGNGRLPDIGLGINDSPLFGQQGAAGRAPDQHEGSPALLGNGEPNLPVQADPGMPQGLAGLARRPDPGGGAGVQPPMEPPAQPAEEQRGEGVGDAGQVPNNTVAQSALQNRISALQTRNEELEEELRSCRQELSSHRTRLEEMQARHDADLEAIRRAGSETLAVVVEEYKEQSRAVVLEQQEQAQHVVTEAGRELSERLSQILDAQERNHQEGCERDREENTQQTTRAIEEARQRQQEQFDAYLVEEKERMQQSVQEAVEAERLSGEEKIQSALASEREQARIQLEQARREQTELLEEARRSHETSLASVRQEEVDKAKEQVSEMLTEEKERSREGSQQIMEEMRSEMRTYVEEQRRADSRVRQRQLASLDLFLESCRQQVAMLMDRGEPEPPDEEGAKGSERGAS